MAEIRPQIIYSPEGVLQIKTGLSEDYKVEERDEGYESRLVEHRRRSLGALSVRPGVVIEEVDGLASIEIEVQKRFHKKFNNSGDDDITEFLRYLTHVLPYHPVDTIDRVVSVDMISERGGIGVAHHHFQRWLNGEGISEEVARHCMLAMAEPFGQKEVKKAHKDFRYRSGQLGESAQAWTSSLHVTTENFGIHKSATTPEEHVATNGEISWKYFVIATLGTCACWGVDAEERNHIRVTQETTRLYEFTPHNVDIARQSLSLLLGLGALAHAAAGYQGEEDVFATASWGEPRVYPL